jgi:hypothetical protein
MISNRRGSAVSNEENDLDIDNEGDVIAWDFDTSFGDVASTVTDDKRLQSSGQNDYSMDTSSTFDTVHTRPLRSPSQGQTTLAPFSTSSLPLNGQHGSATEHPLEQLFNDGTIRSATAPPTLRSRKDTIPSRPVSPLPPLNGQHPPSPDSEYRPNTAMGQYDLRLPDITPTGPIQIEIPATEDTLWKDPPGVRSRSATVTRGTRSDSTGSAGFASRVPRHNAADPMPQPQSPPRTSRATSPKPQPPSLPTPQNANSSVMKMQPPLSPPKIAPALPPIPPNSPAKGHIPSKSVPNNSLLTTAPTSNTPLSDHILTKARSADLKSTRPPNLTLNVSSRLMLLTTAASDANDII